LSVLFLNQKVNNSLHSLVNKNSFSYMINEKVCCDNVTMLGVQSVCCPN